MNYLIGREPDAPWKSLSEWRQVFDGIWHRATPELEARWVFLAWQQHTIAKTS